MIEILKIPRFGCDGHEENEIIFVKSAYNLALHLKDNNETSSSKSLSTDPSFWSKLWKIGLPNKITIFIERLLQNFILTNLNMSKKDILV